TNLDFRQTVILPPDAKQSLSASRQPSARVLTAQFANEKVLIQAESPAPAMVVVSQGYYSSWKAFLDGSPVRLWRANYGFQAVEIPAGHHEIQLRYVDTWFDIGLVASAFGLLATLILWRLTARPGT